MTRSPLMSMEEYRAHRTLWHAAGRLALQLPEVKAQGTAWYPFVHSIALDMSEECGVTPLQAAEVIAALSPQCQFEQNLGAAWTLLRNRPGDVIPVLEPNGTTRFALRRPDGKRYQVIGSCVRNAMQIIAGESDVLPATVKTGCFADNIARPHTSERVTIDVWMQRLAGVEPQGSKYAKESRYVPFAASLQDAAWRLGLLPSVLQACLWVLVRDVLKIVTGQRLEIRNGTVHVVKLDGSLTPLEHAMVA